MLNFESPFKLLFHKPPNYFILRVFGCITFPYLRPYHSNKFDFHTEKCVFISYSLYHKGYKCLFITGMIYIMQNVKFNENEFLFIHDLKFEEVTSSQSCPTTSSSIQDNQLSFRCSPSSLFKPFVQHNLQVSSILISISFSEVSFPFLINDCVQTAFESNILSFVIHFPSLIHTTPKLPSQPILSQSILT